MNGIESDFKPPSYIVQDTWRYVVFAVIFGLTLLAAILVLAFCWTLRPACLAALFTAVLWFFVFLLMVVGVGLFNGVHTVRFALVGCVRVCGGVGGNDGVCGACVRLRRVAAVALPHPSPSPLPCPTPPCCAARTAACTPRPLRSRTSTRLSSTPRRVALSTR